MIPTMTFVDDVLKHSPVLPGYAAAAAGLHTEREYYNPYPLPDSPVLHTLAPSQPPVNIAFTYNSGADRMSPYINEPFGYCRSIGIWPIYNPGSEANGGCSPVYSRSAERLQSIQDVSGVPVTVCWSGNLIASIQELTDRRTTFQYDSQSAAPLNLLTTITWPTGRHTEFQYSNISVGETTDWMLTEVREEDGSRTSYTYGPDGRITQDSSQDSGADSCTNLADGLQIRDEIGGIARQLTDGIAPIIRYIDPFAPDMPIATDAQCRLFMRAAKACAGKAGLAGANREDFVQDFVHKMLALLHDYPVKTAAWIAAPGWLSRTAANLANDFADHVRLNVRREVPLTETAKDFLHRCNYDAEEWLTGPEVQLLGKERRAWLKMAMRCLNPDELELLVRHAVYDERLTEIAAATGRTPNAVGKEFNRLRRRLAMQLRTSNYYEVGEDPGPR